jgi:spoIIIJ-associated protein
MTESETSQLNSLIQDLVGRMGVSCEVAIIDEDQSLPLKAHVTAYESGKFLIGKNGQNLSALEHVVRAMWSRKSSTGRTVTVDVNDYRQERIVQLVADVRQAATRVRDTRKSEALPPMSSYERRIVHTELASWGDVSTESVGQDTQRRVVIKPL